MSMMCSRTVNCAEASLDFKSLHLYGRDEEVESLRQAYQQQCVINPPSSRRPQIVWISGNPGVGKSTLVEHVLSSKNSYCSGKFERLQSSMPYSALTQLLTRVQHVLAAEDHKITGLNIDDEASLCHLLPEISSLLAASPIADDSSMGAKPCGSCSVEWGLERLKQALRVFLRAVCDVLESPLIMFLDDLQWADSDTLEILKHLLIGSEQAGQEGSGILFVGAYRANEVQEDGHPMAVFMREISEHCQQDPDYHIPELHLSNLDEAATNKLVADLIHTKPDEVAELSKLVHSKTDGNCFYTLHVLRHIHETDLLYLSRRTLRWEWDADGIQEEVQVSDDIAEFMTKKLKKLPQSTLDALTMSAFLGTKIEIELLESLYPLINSDASSPLLDLLEPAVEANLIEMNRSNSNRTLFKFTHDRITAAAYNMIPEGVEKQKLHLKIGWELYRLSPCENNTVSRESSTSPLTTERKHWQLVLAVDQLNRGADLTEDQKEKELLSGLNLNAAKQVIQTGAFKLATRFLDRGLSLVGEQRWKMCYALTLQLSVTLASVHYSYGRMQESLDLLDEIFANAKCPADKYEAHSIQVEVLESMGLINLCLEVGLNTLKELGHPKIPKKPHLGHTVVSVFSAQRTLRRMTDGDILSLPVCTDPKKEFLMRHLTCLSTIAYFACLEEMAVVMTYRVLQMSFRYGVTKYSPPALCMHAFAVAVMGDHDGAFQFGEIALQLMKRLSQDYRTSSFVYCCLRHLKKPIHECVNSTLLVYESAFSAGDLRSAGMSCLTNCVSRYCAGLPLESIAKDAFAFCNQLKKYEQHLNFKYLIFTLRAVLELMGRVEDLSMFVENPGNDQAFELFVDRDGDKNGLRQYWYHEMEVRFRLGDFDSALQFAEKKWRAQSTPQIFVSTPSHALFSSLIALEAWKKRRKRRHWRIFRKSHKMLVSWVEQKGNLNTRHIVLLLDAELAAVKKQDPDTVRCKFESSIALASRCGFISYSALASERAGQYFLQQNDTYWAEYYFTNSRQLYADWNATAKVRQMEKAYGRLVGVGQLTVSESLSIDRITSSRRSNFSLTGRSRLSVVEQVEARRDSDGTI